MRITKQYGAIKYWIAAGLIGAALGTSSIQAQTTVTTFSTADTMIFGGSGFESLNRGLQPELYVGDPGVGESRALVQFSLASIPAGQLITSATLKLHLNVAPPNQHNVDGYRLLVDWVEGDGPSAGGTFGATWIDRDKGNGLPNWTVAGASGAGSDRAVTSSFTLTLADQTLEAGLPVVTKDVTSDVQAWYTGAAPNFGWLLQSSIFTATVYTGYGAREQGGTTLDPQLIITYVPEPSSALLLLLGGFAVLRRRARSL